MNEFSGGIAYIDVDVCVVGGGMAGVCAALAAARHGANTALVQDRPVLGGNASSEIRMHICGADHFDVIWRETGILEELRIESLLYNDEHNTTIQDIALYDACRRQPGLQLFLNSQVTGCDVENRRVNSCNARELTSGRVLHITAEQFVDASGDGALAYLAGADYRYGREGAGEFNESLAPEEADFYTMGHSILFHAKDVGRPVPFTAPPWALKFESDDELPGRWHGGEFGYWWIEWGGTMDTITDSEAIKDELLAAALGLWDHMKNKGDHGFANYNLNWVGFLPGRRESRRFAGDVILTQNDLQSGRQWQDQIAYGGWPIDTHPPLGFRSPEPPCCQVKLDRPFGVPLRACYCKGFENLYLAGRNISASHIAFASTRIMATCALVGQGVGTAAALALKHKASAGEMAENYVKEVQQALLSDGAYLLDVNNSDSSDLARSASVSASSSMGPDFAAEKVLDGINHPEPENWHCWRSDPEKGLPAWIELMWDKPVELSHVRLVLDTDFESRMCLTQSTNFAKQTKPVPRDITPKDIHIDIKNMENDEWATVANISGNYQRLVCADFPSVKTNAIRIITDSAWGVDYASIFEIRCYKDRSVMQ